MTKLNVIDNYTPWFRKVATAGLMILFFPLITMATILDGKLYETNTVTPDSVGVFIAVEEMPEIIGGLSELYRLIRYPSAALRNHVEGRVFLQFIVNEDGKATDIEILRDIGSGCGQAAVEAIERVRFTPGRQNGIPVKVKFSIPVTFRINT
jgi:TonB family protein